MDNENRPFGDNEDLSGENENQNPAAENPAYETGSAPSPAPEKSGMSEAGRQNPEQSAPPYPGAGHDGSPYSGSQSYYAQYGSGGYQNYGAYHAPYGQPGYAPRPEPPRYVSSPVGFTDNTKLAKILVVVGVAFVVLTFFSVFFSRDYLNMVVSQQNIRNLAGSGLYYLGTSLLSLASSAFTVLTLVFIYRANQNLSFIGCPVKKYSPGWAVAWFIIPVVNLVMSFPVMKEIWEGSQPGYYNWSADGKLPEKPSSAMVIFWFAMRWVSLVAGLVIMIGTIAGAVTNPAMAVSAALGSSVILSSISVIYNVIFLVMVWRIAERQKAKFDTAQAYYYAKGRGGRQ